MICAHQRGHEGRNPYDFDGLTGAGDQGAPLIATALPKPNQTSERDPLPSLLLNLHKKLNFGVEI